MTEKSYFHSGAARGDAIYAPYSASLFAQVMNDLYSTDEGYVIPDLSAATNPLNVISAAGKTVTVDIGRAFIRGFFYNNSAPFTLTIPDNTSGKPRFDRIILRINWLAQTVRLAVISGTPLVIPDPPALKQTEGEVWEVSLALIYSPTAFAATSDTLIYDERRFINTANHDDQYGIYNLMHNSEFMSCSGESWSNTLCPDLWFYYGTPTIATAEKFSQMHRGRTIQITAPLTTDGLRTTLLFTETVTAVPITLRVLVQASQGAASVAFSGATKVVYPTNQPLEFFIRRTNVGYLTMTVSGGVASSIFKIGQFTASYGHVGAPFAPRSEFIPFNRTVVSSSYGGATAKSTATVTQSTAEWPIQTPTVGEWEVALITGVKAVLVKLGGYDTGSAGGGTG